MLDQVKELPSGTRGRTPLIESCRKIELAEIEMREKGKALFPPFEEWSYS